MSPHPPRSNPTDPLFPHTPHLRSCPAPALRTLRLAACKPAADEARAPAADATTPAQQAPADATSLEPPPPADVAGKPEMPALQVTTLDGKPYDLADHRDNWVVVNFWATWCAPCLKEMPELSALDAMREHVEVIGLAYEDIKPAELRT